MLVFNGWLDTQVQTLDTQVQTLDTQVQTSEAKGSGHPSPDSESGRPSPDSGLQTGGLRASHNLNFLADNQTVCLVMFQALSGTEQVGCGRVLT